MWTEHLAQPVHAHVQQVLPANPRPGPGHRVPLDQLVHVRIARARPWAALQ